MILTAGFMVTGLTLLVAGGLGLGKRDQAAAGFTIAALCAGGSALLGALHFLAPSTQGYGAVAMLMLLGGVGSGLFTTAAALSTRLRGASPLAAGGGVLLVQILLLVDGGANPLTRAEGLGSQLNVALLVLLTLGWVGVGTVLVLHTGRELVRFISSPALGRALSIAGALLGGLIVVGTVLAVVTLAPAQSIPGQTPIALTATALLLLAAAALGTILGGMRLRTTLRPRLLAIEAAVLFWRLARLERRLLNAAPNWAPPAGLSTPTARSGAREALYARMVIIWDTTRALLSVTDTDVVDASLDFVERAEPTSGPARRAALAEAGWLHLALSDRAGQGPGERFTVLPHDGGNLTTDLITEAAFQVQVSKVLHRESALLERFRIDYTTAVDRTG
ncbi:hypothetical protein EV383_6228 [Pseudonocardia sediminis]|uniref:DUF6545 domain-containing protein n=1 Tax=Pseudonocardia sediminis TaxID=1397368 RepID=A0A4Q7U7M5_PSEST|nr:DUF6545 domain-containing protein [Pseudonocardia sediminis]RZT75488.1 hypothetical protein EV383_6228 [Pseudonocardia sediminis]